MNLTKSIDFLLENAGPVIQYRLRKEILHDLPQGCFLIMPFRKHTHLPPVLWRPCVMRIH